LLETQAGRKNAKESEAAVTAADESMVSCQTECSCCLFEGWCYMMIKLQSYDRSR